MDVRFSHEENLWEQGGMNHGKNQNTFRNRSGGDYCRRCLCESREDDRVVMVCRGIDGNPCNVCGIESRGITWKVH